MGGRGANCANYQRNHIPTQTNLELKLQRLRELWKTDKEHRRVIELRARAVIRALEIKKVWKDKGPVTDKKRAAEVIEALF